MTLAVTASFLDVVVDVLVSIVFFNAMHATSAHE